MTLKTDPTAEYCYNLNKILPSGQQKYTLGFMYSFVFVWFNVVITLQIFLIIYFSFLYININNFVVHIQSLLTHCGADLNVPCEY